MILTISGTPGVGKSYIAKKLSKSGLKYFDLNKYIKDKRMYDSYDRKTKTYDVDVKILGNNVNPLFKASHSRDIIVDKLINKKISAESLLKIFGKKRFQGVIIDSHLSHYLDSDYCMIVKTDIKKMFKRLKLRKYPKEKIQENIQSEIFDICLDEAKSLNRKIILVQN